MSIQTWPESAMTADERKALRNELPGYARPIPVDQHHEFKRIAAAAEARSKRLDRIGTLVAIAGGCALPFVAWAILWLIAP